MSTDSNRTKSSAASRPKKPRPDFPLYAHACGRWAKKVRNKVHYFEKWTEDPQGDASLERWLDEKEDLYAGRKPAPKAEPDELTIRDLANHFLTSKADDRDEDRISPRTFGDYRAVTDLIVKVFGPNRAVTNLGPADFKRLRKEITKTRGAVAERNVIQRVRSVFKYALDNAMIQQPIVFGSDFKRPSARIIRRERRAARKESGDRMWEPHEIRLVLSYLRGEDLREPGESEPKPRRKPHRPVIAMVLLAANGGLGQSDLSNLPIDAVDLESGWVDYPRPKTEVERQFALWPETVEALRDWMDVRKGIDVKDSADADLLFVTERGSRWVKSNPNGSPSDGIGQEFNKAITALGIKRPGIGFYALRHGFETIAGETKDQVSVDYIMGHADDSMAAVYRERVGRDRLRAVTDHVRRWLFGGEPEPPKKLKELKNVGDSGPNLTNLISSTESGPGAAADDPPTLRIFDGGEVA
ncbi:tyrosine-type recombinase/integrase [Stratiformator vulcanicus]|uniref:Phage integrase family protein n=1 Tax=Stratiformator vulcanicus TaxID=2527980 RepID=A0A517R5R1_9PLAN|nr:tyrosine-type recombinase/integrase [Stratiformator vulcanicus]QDT39234.1 Phage integrase family protein [Stratiformator vulcanicus]